MNFNMRDYVSDDHIESVGEIAKSQSAIIQALSLENSKLRNQLQQKENIIKEVREYITYWHYRNDFRINSFTTGVKEELLEILDKGE